MKVLVVGGVAGGASTVTRLRRLNEKAEIIIFEKGQYISYANCGMPYYIGDVIKDKENLVVQTPESINSRFNIDVRINHEVIRIDKDKKVVEVLDKVVGKKYSESYDKLVLSPGAEPFRPEIPGIDLDAIFTLRNIPDTYRIRDFVDNMKPKKAIVVGAGFIGIEMAENLKERGLDVAIIELADHVIGPLDFDMARIAQQHIVSKGIDVYLKDAAKSFEKKNNKILANLTSGASIETDMVVLGIGVRPEIKLAKEAGLKIGVTGGIYVNEFLETSDSNIYAVGDAIEVNDYISNNHALIPLAGPANKQGRIVANNICGREEKYVGTMGTSILKVFNMTVALVGNNERILKKNNMEYEKSFTHSQSHAGYYPGSLPMTIKLIFDKSSGKILGCQIVGYEGVDKRIDVIATAIKAGMTVYDLQELELSYAPPYSSAKDPVNMAGFVASNILRKDCDIFHWHDITAGIDDTSILLDVRTDMEYNLGTINGAINIPVDELRDRINELPKNKTIYAFCQVGLRGYIACRILNQMGYKTKNLSGGYKLYHIITDQESKVNHDDINKDIEISEGTKANKADEEISVSVDACGLQCPGPILKVYEKIKDMKDGEILSITASDPAFERDIKVWCERTGNELLSMDFKNNMFNAVIKKAGGSKGDEDNKNKNNKSIILFSNDLDKTIATFIIANGAASMGRQVCLFFTFWGLNILRKNKKVKVKKNIIEKMFAFKMPRGSEKLSLSKMNMFGIGAKLIRGLMKKKNVLSLEELIAQARANGVKFIACSMSMDIMGIKKEELIDGVEIGGVASFLAFAEESDTSLFI